MNYEKLLYFNGFQLQIYPEANKLKFNDLKKTHISKLNINQNPQKLHKNSQTNHIKTEISLFLKKKKRKAFLHLIFNILLTNIYPFLVGIGMRGIEN